MYETRIKWAELWFRALGYNDDYEVYCEDVANNEPIDERLLIHHPSLPRLYDFFGDIYRYMPDVASPYTIEDYQVAFNKWLAVNRYKLMPLKGGIEQAITSISDDLVRNRFENLAINHDELINLINQPELTLYKVGNWDSDNHIESTEKRLDIYHLTDISRLHKLDIVKWITRSGKPCWQSITDKVNESICNENNYSENLVTLESVKFDVVRDVYNNQIKQLFKNTYTIIQSAIIDKFPSHFKLRE